MKYGFISFFILLLFASCGEDSESTLAIVSSSQNPSHPVPSNPETTDETTDDSSESPSEVQPAPNNLPQATGVSSVLTEDTTLTSILVGVDDDGDALVYSIVTTPAHGVVIITDSSTGAFQFVPANGYYGADSFTFKVNDGKGDSNTATVTLDIREAISFGVVWFNDLSEVGTEDQGKAIIADSDSNIFITGYITQAGPGFKNMYLTKYKKDGTLDTSFGVAGIVIYTGSTGDSEGSSIALDGNGNIYISGYQYIDPINKKDATIWKYNSSGVLDTSFGASGIVNFNNTYNNNDLSLNIQVDSNDYIYISIDSTTNSNTCFFGSACVDILVNKYNSDGTLETNFGTNGVLKINSANDTYNLISLLLDGLGSLYINYRTAVFGFSKISRLSDVTGSVDTSYATAGTMTFDGSIFLYGLRLGNYGNLFFTGHKSFSDLVVGKIDSTGVLDTNFGTSGYFNHKPDGSNLVRGHSLAIDSNDNIFVVGKEQNTNTDIGIWKLDSSGVLDTDFQMSGHYFENNIGGGDYMDWLSSVVLAPNGGIYATGHTSTPGNDHDTILFYIE